MAGDTSRYRYSCLRPAFAAAFLLALSHGALADPTAYAPPGPGPHFLAIQVPVTASIGTVCGFAPSAAPQGTYDAGDIRDAFGHNFDFALRCNVPLRMAVVSSHGALETSGTPESGYTNKAPYKVTLDIKGANNTEVSDTCDASDIKSTNASSSCSFFGTADTDTGLLMDNPSYNVNGSYLRVSSTGYSGSPILMASDNYGDTLTVTVSAAQ